MNYTEMVKEIPDTAVARGLGFASVLIGLTEIAAPKQIERLMGIGNGQHTGVLRVLGVREIMQGVDILTHDNPRPGIWARIAGDALDGVVLAAAGTKTRRPGGFLAACAMVLPIVLLDIVSAARLSRQDID